jgi:hypothetical protein
MSSDGEVAVFSPVVLPEPARVVEVFKPQFA